MPPQLCAGHDVELSALGRSRRGVEVRKIKRDGPLARPSFVVELIGLEPTTPCMPCKCSTS